QTELDKHEKITCKSATGSRGLSVYYFEKKSTEVIVKIQKEKFHLTQVEFNTYVKEKILNTNRGFIVQPFIESVTDSGNPFDIRAHLMKGEDGQWNIAKIYPRIGVLGTAISNLHLGGSTCDLDTLITKQDRKSVV